MGLRSNYIAGVRVDFGSKKSVIKRIDELIKRDERGLIATVNPEFIMDAQSDKQFMDLLNSAKLCVPDGVGVLYADEFVRAISRIKRNILFPFKVFIAGIKVALCGHSGERIAGAELVYDMCKLAEERGYSVFFLGGWAKNTFGKPLNKSGKIAQRAAKEIKKMYPGLKIIGTSSEYKRSKKDDRVTVSYIQDCMKQEKVEYIDIIFVAYNHKYQEDWIRRNMKKIPATIGMGVGGSFDMVIGTQKGTPGIFIDNNVEWLYRLFTQPWRIWRILKAFPVFPLYVLYLSVKNAKNY